MKHRNQHSISGVGYKTSINIEPEFWAALKASAEATHTNSSELVRRIAVEWDRTGRKGSLASAIRVYLLLEAQRKATNAQT